MGGVGALGVAQRVAVHIGGVHLAGNRLVLVGGDLVVAGDRVVVRVAGVVELGRVVDGIDADVDGGGGGATLAIRDGDGERVRTVVVLVGRVGPVAVGVDGDAAVGGVGALGIAQRVAVHIGGVHLAADGLVLVGGDLVVAGDRVVVRVAGVVELGRVVDGIDADVDGGGGGAALAIRDGDGERVRTVVVLVGRVGPVAVGVDGDAAVGGVGALGVAQRVAVHIGGVHLAADGLVLVGGDLVVAGDRVVVRVAGVVELGRVVDGIDADVDGGGGGAALAVRDGDGERVRTVVVLVGRVGPVAIGIDGDAAMGGVGALGEGQSVTIRIGGLHLAGNRLVLIGREAVIARGRIEVALTTRTAGDELRCIVAIIQHGRRLDAAIQSTISGRNAERLGCHHLDDAVHAQAFAHRGPIAASQAGSGGVLLVSAFDGADHIIKRLAASVCVDHRLGNLAMAHRGVMKGQGPHLSAWCRTFRNLQAGIGAGHQPIARHQGVAHLQRFGGLLTLADDLGSPLQARNNAGRSLGRRLGHGNLSKCNCVMSIPSDPCPKPDPAAALCERLLTGASFVSA